MRGLKYLSVYLFIALSVIAYTLGGWWGLALPVVAFGLLPLLELFLTQSEANPDVEEEERLKNSMFFDLAVYLAVPAQYGLLFYFLWQISTKAFSGVELVGLIATMGICCGVFGINVAHELGHRKKKHEQWMAKSLLLTSLYMHFFIEHNRGHHAKVATPDDPASARYGEGLYRFWWRSVSGSLRSAWELETRRLSRRELPWWQNEVLWYHVIQVGFVALIGVVFGGLAMVCFLAAAVGGFLLLETVNYIEHYGLTRGTKDNGRYEKVLPIHSWNANHPLGRLFLFELTRHSDHHANATRKYQLLRHFDESPQMPTGYPGMMVLACVPPLWFKVMHAHIARYQRRLEGMEGAAAQAA